jgi:hypothetical protein
MAKIKYNKDTIFQVNHEGYATIFNGPDGKNYQSVNAVKDFVFRDEDYHDGTDYYELKAEEIEKITDAFQLELIDNKQL